MAARKRKARYSFDFESLKGLDADTGEERLVEERMVHDQEFLGRWMALVRKGGCVEERVKTYPWMTLIAIKRRMNLLREEARYNGLDIPPAQESSHGTGASRPRFGQDEISARAA